MQDKAIYHVIGLMSGTSLDGLDMAYCEFIFKNQQWSYNLLFYQTIEYPEEIIALLKEAYTCSGRSALYDHALL